MFAAMGLKVKQCEAKIWLVKAVRVKKRKRMLKKWSHCLILNGNYWCIAFNMMLNIKFLKFLKYSGQDSTDPVVL